MHGNVWEWCDDEQKGDNGASNRVYRGGCWYFDSGSCRASARLAYLPSLRNHSLGLRLALVPVGKTGK
jgi:formylglycine-generating enzyme required for sulfatase activity